MKFRMGTTDQGAFGWHKSTYSGANTGCIEQGVTPGGDVAVRDTKMDGVGPVLRFGQQQWLSFVQSVKE